MGTEKAASHLALLFAAAHEDWEVVLDESDESMRFQTTSPETFRIRRKNLSNGL